MGIEGKEEVDRREEEERREGSKNNYKGRLFKRALVVI